MGADWGDVAASAGLGRIATAGSTWLACCRPRPPRRQWPAMPQRAMRCAASWPAARERPAPRATRPRPPDPRAPRPNGRGPIRQRAGRAAPSRSLLSEPWTQTRGRPQGRFRDQASACARACAGRAPGRSARAWATSGMPARLHNVLRQHPRHRGSPSEPSGRSVTDWASVAVREAARGRKAARTRQAHVSAYS